MNQDVKQSTIFESEIPKFQVTKKNTITLILFTAVFAVVFLNLYAPFGFKSRFWEKITDLDLLLYSSGATLAGMLIVVISRATMFSFCKRYTLKYRIYILWIMLEIVSMAFFYTILQYYVLKDGRNFYDLLKLSIKNTALVLLLPYSITWLYFSWLDKNSKIAALLNSSNTNAPEMQESTRPNAMIAFNDSTGTMRITIKSDDLFYIEAADNYVKVFYKKGNRIARNMIRNTLKNLETDLIDTSLVRCHRSYMINFDKVKVIEKGKTGLQVILDHSDEITIPVSKTYANSVMGFFANSSIDEE